MNSETERREQSFTHRGLTFKSTEVLGIPAYVGSIGCIDISIRLLGDWWCAMAVVVPLTWQPPAAIAVGFGETPEAAIEAMCHNYTIERRWLSGEMIPSDALEELKPPP